MKKLLILLILLMIFTVHGYGNDADTQSESEEISIKVILYHNITYADSDGSNPYVVSLPKFEKQMKWLKANNYECITVSDMLQKLTENSSGKKYAVITFDDGYPDVYTYAFPLLSAFGFPATTFLVADKINSPKNLTADMIRDLYDAGWEIGSHSMTHSDLMNHEDLDTEICGSRNLIATITGIPLAEIVSFAYPYGNADETVTTKVWKCGYQSGAGLGQIPVSSSQNLYYFSRHPVTSDMTIEDFSSLFNSGDKK